MTIPADISDDAIRSLLHREKDEPLPEDWLAWLKQEVLAAPWEAVHNYNDDAGAIFTLRMCRAIVEYQKSVSPEWQFNEWVSKDHLSEAVTCAFGLAHPSVEDSDLDFRKLEWMQKVQRLHWMQSTDRDEWHSGMRSGSGMRTHFKPSSRGLQVLAQADNQAQPAATPATAPEASATATETAPPEQPAPKLSRHAVRILEHVKDKLAMPTQDEIKDALQMGKSTVNKAVNDLKSKGLWPGLK